MDQLLALWREFVGAGAAGVIAAVVWGANAYFTGRSTTRSKLDEASIKFTDSLMRRLTQLDELIKILDARNDECERKLEEFRAKVAASTNSR